MKTIFAFALLSAFGLPAVAGAVDVGELPLEALMNVNVTSVSKRPENSFQAAAAICVLSGDDIERSGARTVADALRLAPGVEVARINAHSWAVTARGFNSEFANKLLVLQDGRSVYSPLYSGVYWDAIEPALEDIDRIEVVCGPGGTLWGANAVNGVINIITKSAKDTQGWLFSGGGGTEDHGFGSFRYGDVAGSNLYFRVFGQYANHDDSTLPTGGDPGDSWWQANGGFRADWDISDLNRLTFQGELFAARENQLRTLANPSPALPTSQKFTDDISGGDVLARWTHEFLDGSTLEVQTYYDRADRESTLPREVRDTFDLDVQHTFAWGDRQRIVWGLGYRLSADALTTNFVAQPLPLERTTHLLSAFAQDELTLVADRLRVALGSKFEHNSFTGFEIQPSARLAWTPTDRQTFWASVARAVRTPNRSEDDTLVNVPAPSPFPPGFVAAFVGDRDGDSEELVAYELGYRIALSERVTLDVAAFYNCYDRLRSLDGPVAPPPPAVVAFVTGNRLKGESYGVEFTGQWQATERWRWEAGYTWLRLALHPREGGTDTTSEHFLEGNSPRNQLFLSSRLDLPHHVQCDATLRYVDRLSSINIPSYFALDIRLAWQPSVNWEVAVVGQNLLDSAHPEFSPTIIGAPQTEVEQSVYVKATWRY